jgi:hypothetical protein
MHAAANTKGVMKAHACDVHDQCQLGSAMARRRFSERAPLIISAWTASLADHQMSSKPQLLGRLSISPDHAPT